MRLPVWIAAAVLVLAFQVSAQPVQPGGVLRDASAVYTVQNVPKPTYLTPIPARPFGTMLTRISGDAGAPITLSAGAASVWNADARHHYSTDQPWNANQSLIAIDQPGGKPSLLFLDGATYKPKYAQCPNYNRQDDRWHPTMPNVRVNANGTLLEWFDVVQCKQLKKWALPFAVTYIGLTGGNISDDGQFVLLGDTTRMFVVDMMNDKIGPVASTAWPGQSLGHTTISPSGKYAFLSYRGDQLRVFVVDSATLSASPRSMAFPPGCHGTREAGFLYDLGHTDLTRNPFDNNEDVVVGQEHCGKVGQTVQGQVLGHVLMVRLRDGKLTSLTDPRNEAYASHISTQNSRRPGWAYVSYFQNETGRRFDQELVSVKLDGSKTVERWVHHHTNDSACYRCEADPVPSRDGLRVLFTSDWMIDCGNGCGTQALRQDYIADGRPR